jgi:hypothetical protein
VVSACLTTSVRAPLPVDAEALVATFAAGTGIEYLSSSPRTGVLRSATGDVSIMIDDADRLVEIELVPA